MKTNFDAPVIIAGGGPVGLLAALDLDSRGVASIVIESRTYLDAPYVKCNHVASRTMERFRQLGFADDVRKAGLPADYPHDVAFRTSVVGAELSRIHIASPAERSESPLGPDSAWATPEPPHRINQMYLEPILMQRAAGRPNIQVLYETECLSYEQDDHGVSVVTRRHDDEEVRILRGAYLIGADGGRSLVRKQMGVRLSGDAVLQYVQSTFFRAPGLLGEMTDSSVDARAWAYYAYNPRRRGHVYAIDGKELFLVHNYLTFEEHEGDTVNRDQALRDILGVDAAFSYEELSQQDWVARRLLADTFRDGRVFLAGDASHLWVPYAGFGMNAGIADVLNLTWLLNAVLAGWGDPGILDAYEAERRPITEQVSRLVMAHQQKVASATVPEWIEEDSTRGREARELIGREAYELNVQQFAAEGLNFGYTYGTSPIIAHDGCEPPAFSMARYEPSTVPGSRAPHFSLGDGRSLYDLLDRDFTLLTFDEDDLSADGATCLMQAAARVGVPLSHLPLAPGEAPAVYDRKFVIVRGDQHIVWRGDFVPSSEAGLFERLRGADPHPADASSERGLSEPAVGRRS